MTQQDIAKTIVNQLASIPRLMAMCNGRNFVALDRTDNRLGGVMFSFSGSRQVNKCVIQIDYSDTYTFMLYKSYPSTGESAEIYTCEGVYADMLTELFEENTGLYLSLGTMRSAS